MSNSIKSTFGAIAQNTQDGHYTQEAVTSGVSTGRFSGAAARYENLAKTILENAESSFAGDHLTGGHISSSGSTFAQKIEAMKQFSTIGGQIGINQIEVESILKGALSLPNTVETVNERPSEQLVNTGSHFSSGIKGFKEKVETLKLFSEYGEAAGISPKKFESILKEALAVTNTSEIKQYKKVGSGYEVRPVSEINMQNSSKGPLEFKTSEGIGIRVGRKKDLIELENAEIKRYDANSNLIDDANYEIVSIPVSDECLDDMYKIVHNLISRNNLLDTEIKIEKKSDKQKISADKVHENKESPIVDEMKKKAEDTHEYNRNLVKLIGILNNVKTEHVFYKNKKREGLKKIEDHDKAVLRKAERVGQERKV